MTAKFIAVTHIESEYLYRRSTMIAVPTSSAQAIADALNGIGYCLCDGEKWWVYENDSVSDDYIQYEIKRFQKRKGKLVINDYEHTW